MEHSPSLALFVLLPLLTRGIRGWGKRDWIENDPNHGFLRDGPRAKALMARLA